MNSPVHAGLCMLCTCMCMCLCCFVSMHGQVFPMHAATVWKIVTIGDYPSACVFYCVWEYVYGIYTLREWKGKDTHSCTTSPYANTHLHAATSCSLHRATMWRVQSLFPSQATALSGLKWQPLSPTISVHAAIAGGDATTMATCFLVLQKQLDLVSLVVKFLLYHLSKSIFFISKVLGSSC